MTEVSPEELEKYSKSQLIAFIEQQNEQLTRFDGRFRGKNTPASDVFIPWLKIPNRLH